MYGARSWHPSREFHHFNVENRKLVIQKVLQIIRILDRYIDNWRRQVQDRIEQADQRRLVLDRSESFFESKIEENPLTNLY